jgi:hypothetical protein
MREEFERRITRRLHKLIPPDGWISRVISRPPDQLTVVHASTRRTCIVRNTLALEFAETTASGVTSRPANETGLGPQWATESHRFDELDRERTCSSAVFRAHYRRGNRFPWTPRSGSWPCRCLGSSRRAAGILRNHPAGRLWSTMPWFATEAIGMGLIIFIVGYCFSIPTLRRW